MKISSDRTVTQWPDQYRPQVSPVYAYNELTSSAPADIVWAWLIRAPLWPTWYVNSRNVCIESSNKLDLALGSTFSWTTFNVPVRTTVVEFEPLKYLVWSGSQFGSSGYHSWTIKSQGTGCHIITEETQQGLIPSIFRIFLRRGLLHYHQLWLEGLDKMARSGLPPIPKI